MKDDVYYNRSHCYDPTAGKAITNIARDSPFQSFYNSRAWKRCRDGFMKSKYFICDRCDGVAVIAHHKKYISPANINKPEITLNWDNLEALCIDCHNAEHKAKQATANGISFDGDGKIIYTPPVDEKKSDRFLSVM